MAYDSTLAKLLSNYPVPALGPMGTLILPRLSTNDPFLNLPYPVASRKDSTASVYLLSGNGSLTDVLVGLALDSLTR